MTILELFILAVGLSMDAFAVAVCKGLAIGKINMKHALIVGLWFGGFQALMPLVGYLLGSSFAEYIAAVDHWIAMILLALIGVNMVRESRDKDPEHADPSLGFKTMLVMAVATSIDALAVGVSMAVTGYDTWSSLSLPLAVIGLVSFFFALLGHWLGIRYGRSVSRRLQPEMLGGVILVALGIKILLL